MFVFTGYGEVVEMQMGEGVCLAVKTPGKYSKILPVFFPKRMTRPKVGQKVFINNGEVVLSKRDFILLKVISWQTLDASVRGEYEKVQETGTNVPPGGDY